jgi:hypothetical protein
MPTGEPTLEPDELRAIRRKEMEKAVIRLQDELDRLIKMYAFLREALENEIYSGLGYKQLTASEKDVKKLKELTVGMNSLVETKIKYDKAQKQMAASMTLAEELDAVFKFIMTLGYVDRNNLRRRLSDNGVWKWGDHTPETGS